MRFVTHWLPVVVWSALILAAANDTLSAENSGGWFQRIFGFELPWVLHVAVRKLAHVVEYGILAALAWRASRSFGAAVAIALVVAIADETLQSLSRLRTGSAWDVAIDAAGAAIGAALARRLSR